MASKNVKPCSERKRKRNVLTIAHKIEIIKKIENGVNRNVIMQQYNIGSSTIYDIKAQKDELLNFAASSQDSAKATSERKNLRKPKLDQLDKALFEWFMLKHSEGVAVSGPTLISKAKELKVEMGITEDCVFSDGWLTCFKLRHGIRKLDVSDEKKSENQDAADKYCEIFKQWIKENDVAADQIYNADETVLFWRCLPTSILADEVETSASAFQQNMDRVTVLTCTNAAGTHKVKLLVIGKYNRPRELEEVSNLPAVYKVKKNDLIDKDIFMEWFTSVFVPEVKKNLKEKGMPPNSKCVLLLDNCDVHPNESQLVSECGNIVACYLPGNVSYHVQPMTQGIIQNFKGHYRAHLLRKLINNDISFREFQNRFSIKDAVFLAALAWDTIKPITLRSGWRKLWPSEMFKDASSDKDDFEGFSIGLTDEAVQQILDIVKATPLINPVAKLQENEIREWIEIDEAVEVSETVERINSLDHPEKSKDTEDSEEEDLVVEAKNISWNTAEQCLQTFIKFLEQTPSFSAAEVMQAHVLSDILIQKKQTCFQQSTLQKSISESL